jgi:hypothetical protein
MKSHLLPRVALLCMVSVAAAAPLETSQPAQSQPATTQPAEEELEFDVWRGLGMYTMRVPPGSNWALEMTVAPSPGIDDFLQSLAEGGGRYIAATQARPLLAEPDRVRAWPLGGTGGVLAEGARIAVFASSKEQGKALVLALLAGYRTWWQENGRQFVEKRLKGAHGELERARQSLATINEIWPLPTDKLADLRIKQLMLDVNMKGVQTRIKAAREASPISGRHTEQLQFTVTDAQIELAGLLAEKERIAEIIKAYDYLEMYHRPAVDIGKMMQYLQDQIRVWEEALASLPLDSDVLAKVKDGKVSVKPLDVEGMRQQGYLKDSEQPAH